MRRTVSETANPWRFFILALGVSWFFWMWVIVFGWNVWKFPAVLFGAFGLFGPAFAELILISRSGDEAQWRDYWHRVFDFRRIGWRWQLVIWLTFPVLNGAVLALSARTGASLPEFETARNLLAQPWKILPFAIFILLFGPLPEELGWRGYALDGLQLRFNALSSSLILGVVWALWHLPLFFMRGTFQHDQLGLGTTNFWTYIFGPFILSVLFTWIYNNTGRSTLSAILFHFMINFSAELLPLPDRGRLYSLLLILVVTAAVAVIWGPETLTGWKGRQGEGEKRRWQLQV